VLARVVLTVLGGLLDKILRDLARLQERVNFRGVGETLITLKRISGANFRLT